MMKRAFPLSLLGSAGRGLSIRGSVISLLVAILFSQSMVIVTAEIIDLGMDMIIDATSDEVHFISGFLRAPASIDLSNIRWITNEEIIFEFGDDTTVIDDFYEGFSYETMQPSFFDSEHFSVEETIGDDDYASDEGITEEENDSEGDITDDGSIVEEDTGSASNSPKDEETSMPSIDSENEEQVEDSLGESEVEVATEAPDTETPTEGLNMQDEDIEGEDGKIVDEDESNEHQDENEEDSASDSSPEDEGEEPENEGEKDGAIESQDEENENQDENQEDSAPDSSPEDKGEEPENEGEKDGTIASEEEENENQDQNQEDSAPDSSPEDEEDELEFEVEENDAEEPSPDTQSEEDDSNASDGVDGGSGENKNENDEGEHPEDNDQNGDMEDGETETEEKDDDAEEPSADTQSSEDDGSEATNDDGDIDNKGTEDDDGEEVEETGNIGESKNVEDPLPDKNNEDVDGDLGDDGNEENGGEQPSTDGQDGDDPVEEDADAEESSTSSPSLESGGDRILEEDGDLFNTINQVVDIALFLIPESCEKDKWGNCDWVTLGVGAYDDEMQQGMSYCCSKDTAFREVCESSDIGTLMIDEKRFEGTHRQMQVPSKPLEEFYLDDPIFDVNESGDYVLVIANCNDDGFGIITLGNMEWKSVDGYLPGKKNFSMFVYGASTAVFFVLALWYHCGMRMFQDAAIPIQKYILASIILGFLATAFLAIDLLIWNITGMRSIVVMYIALALKTLFQGLLRCLGVMVAMGWGVVRDTLGMALCKIILLGLLYSGLSLLWLSLDAAASSAQLVSSTEQEELVDLALILKYVIDCINIIFYFWIISSVKATTEYLRNMNQTSKLRRHLRLRCIIIISFIIISSLAVVTFVQTLANKFDQIDDIKIFNSDSDIEWIMEAVRYGNYLFILFGVTILWRPNADAKDYAMQMQIATEDDENDLELSCVVPSADDVDIGEGYKIDDAVIT